MSWCSLARIKHAMFNLGAVQSTISIPFSSLQRKEVSRSLRLLMFLPSSSWSKLHEKKTLSTHFFLVLLDIFILGSSTRASNKSCELTEQVGKVVSLISLFFFSLIRQIHLFLALAKTQCTPHSLFNPAPPLVISAGIISSWGKELTIKYTKGLQFPLDLVITGLQPEYMHISAASCLTRFDWILIEISYQTELY